MIIDEPVILLRLTNQLLAIAIVVVVIIIGLRHFTTRKFNLQGAFAMALTTMFAFRLLMSVFGDTGINIFGDAWRHLSNSVSSAILVILLGYLVWDIKYREDT